jgi:predicted anti-sigma-YlaC factor YlaD
MDERLTCRELVALATDFLEDALAPDERALVEEHLAACPGCRAYLGQLEATARLMRAAVELERRPQVAELLRALRDFDQVGPPRQAG